MYLEPNLIIALLLIFLVVIPVGVWSGVSLYYRRDFERRVSDAHREVGQLQTQLQAERNYQVAKSADDLLAVWEGATRD